MIPDIYVEQWQPNAPWQTAAMIEQDLVISRALVDLYNQPKVKGSLVFRGGTALNKLYIQPPARYSEDIDLVQIKSEPIGESLDAIRRALDPWLGEPRRNLTERSAKLQYRYTSVDNTPAKLKIEINTTEHFNALPLKIITFPLASKWFSGTSKILTYELDELMATKLRALHQRRKGRDLFDLWFVLKNQLINVNNTINIFERYGEFNKKPITRAQFEQSLSLKKQHHDFSTDIAPLISPAVDWHFERALNLVQEKLISKLKGSAWLGSSELTEIDKVTP